MSIPDFSYAFIKVVQFGKRIYYNEDKVKGYVQVDGFHQDV
jgi:hypothetical protein